MLYLPTLVTGDVHPHEHARGLGLPPHTRPPIGFLGYGWESDDRNWHDIFYLQPGVPLGLCAEVRDGGIARA